MSCGICGRQSGTGAGFPRVLRFPLPIRIPTAPHSSTSGAGTIGQLVTEVPSGLSLTPPQYTIYILSRIYSCNTKFHENRQLCHGVASQAKEPNVEIQRYSGYDFSLCGALATKCYKNAPDLLYFLT
jgi:hypothetical protein